MEPKLSTQPCERIDYHPPARLSKIQFGLLSDTDVDLLSVIVGTDATNDRVGITRWQDLHDTRLGIPNKNQKCASCNGTRRGTCDFPNSCDGHFGHISLPAPIYHPHFIRNCRKVLSSICLGCSRVLHKKKRKNVLDAVFSDRHEDNVNSASGFVFSRKRKRNDKSNHIENKTRLKRKRLDKSKDENKIRLKRKRIVKREDKNKAFQLIVKSEDKNKALDDAELMQLHERGDIQLQTEEYGSPYMWTPSVPLFMPGQFTLPKFPTFFMSGPLGFVLLKSDGLGFPRFSKLEPIEVSCLLAENVSETPSVPEMPSPSNADESLVCNYCGGPDGRGSKLPKIKVKVIRKILEYRRGNVDTIQLVVDEKSGDLPAGFWDFVDGDPTSSEEKTRLLLPDEADRILRKIPKQEIRKLDMNMPRAPCPDSFVMRRMLVSPNCNRLFTEDWNSPLRPRLLQTRTGKAGRLEGLVKKAKQVRRAISDTTYTGAKAYIAKAKASEELQLLTARHFRACKVVNYNIMTGEMVEETGGSSLENKWLKNNVLAKISNYSARSIVHGDPWIRIEEVGIPYEMAQRLTVDEKVNALNIRRWQKLVDDYMMSDNLSMPGALFLKTKEIEKDLEFLRTMRKAPKVKLGVGDTIRRSLKDGDRVFVNRNPSLHKHSLITLTVKVHILSTIAINPLVCSPFDADFDGDALHIFVPQSLETRAENEELMTVHKQLISPQGGQPIIGLTQDSLVAGHLLTTGHIFICRRDMQQLSMWTSSGIPIPAIVKALNRTGPLWTGKQLFGMTLPNGLVFGSLSWTATRLLSEPISSPEKEVLIQDGEVLICQGGAKWLQRSPNGVVRAIFDQAGPLAAVEHLNCLQAVLHQWLLIRGFSASLLDFYAAEGPGARKRMLMGVHRALKMSDLVSMWQARLLKRQIYQDSGDAMEEHEGYNPSLLLQYTKSSQRIAALEKVVVERFEPRASSLIDNVVSGYMDKENSLLAMVRSGSKGSMSKLTPQVGCLGLQPRSERMRMHEGSYMKLSYFQESLEKEGHIQQIEADAALGGYWESRGIIQSSYLDGLNVREFFLDSISSRFKTSKQGVNEPYQILKSLMVFLRDLKVEYDGTVRLGSSQNIIQFEYGTPNGGPLDKNHWSHSRLAGEPVGVLAATSIAEPAYNATLQSTHPGQVFGTGPIQLLKETLMVRFKTKLKLNDRRCILRLHQGFGKERRALEIQRQLQKVSLDKITLTSSIEFWKFDEKSYPTNSKIPNRQRSPWVGHLQLCKRTMEENKLSIDTIIERLSIQKLGNQSLKESYDIDFSYSDDCSSEVHPESEGLCISFFLIIPPDSVATTALLLESMKTRIMPAVLNATIRGSADIETVRIFWEEKGSESRLSEESTSLGSKSSYRTRRPDPGELAIEVVVNPTKGLGKRGAAWLTLKEACISVLNIVDWSRSCPYAVQEVYRSYGVEAARHVVLKRLTLAVENIGRPVLPKHMILVANTMAHCGEVAGLTSAGYRKFCRDLSLSAPFTEAAFQRTKKNFLDAAVGGASESIDGGLSSAVWGSRIPLGTGVSFEIIPRVPGLGSLKLPRDFLEVREELSAEDYTEPKVCEYDAGFQESEKCAHTKCFFKDDAGKICKTCGVISVPVENMVHKVEVSTYNHRKAYDHDRNLDRNFPDLVEQEALSSDLKNEKVFSILDTSLPTDYAESMHQHQKDGFKFLWRNLGSHAEGQLKNENVDKNGGCILSHAPGTGKSFLIICFLKSYMDNVPNTQPLIVAPSVVLPYWKDQFAHWKSDIEVITLNEVGDPRMLQRLRKRLQLLQEWKSKRSVCLVSYNLFQSLSEENTGSKRSPEDKLKAEVRKSLRESPGILILDEGHFPRNEGSRILKALRELKTKARILLSGTIFQNNFKELFNTFDLVRPGFHLGLHSSVERGSLPDIANDKKAQNREKHLFWEIGTKIEGLQIPNNALQTFRTLIADFVHHHPGDVLTRLPGLRDFSVLLEPTDLQRALLEALLKLLEKKFDGHRQLNRENGVSLTCVHPGLLTRLTFVTNLSDILNLLKPKPFKHYESVISKKHSDPQDGAKTKFVFDLLRSLQSTSDLSSEKVLIFSQRVPPRDMLESMLETCLNWTKGKEVLRLDGNMTNNERQSIIDKFNNCDPGCLARVLLASTKACGEGISLVGASRVVFLDVDWNPAVITQAICRAFRLGQKKIVYVYRLIAAGTMEEDKYKNALRKYWLSTSIFPPASGESDDTPENTCSQRNENKVEEIDTSTCEDFVLKEVMKGSSFRKVLEHRSRFSNFKGKRT